MVLAILGTGAIGFYRANGASPVVALALGVLGALAIVASLLLHELGHCVFAQYFGIHVRQIQIFMFGGVAEIIGEPRRVSHEVVIAAAGPAVSLALAVIAGVPALALQLVHHEGLLLQTLAFVSGANLMIALFNLIPAFPTDGGRILRALLWGATGDYRLATGWAAGIGIGFAGLLVTWGVVNAIGLAAMERAPFGGMWTVFVGLFLARSATQARRHANITAAMREATVADVMLPVRFTAPSELSLLEVFTSAGGPSAAELLLGFPVLEQGVVAGYVEPARIYAMPKVEWGRLTAGQLMTPLAALPHLAPSDALDVLVRVMAERSATSAFVFHAGALAGYVDRADVARWVMAVERAPVKTV